MKALWKMAKRLHSDQRGAEGLEKLLKEVEAVE